VIIEYIQRHPLLFSVFGTLIICCTGIIGLVLEFYNNTCVDDVKLWLLVCVLRLLCRLALRIYIEAVTQRWILFRGSLLLLHKIIDIVDVFGFVWFAVGNLLVFNNIECAMSSPIVFSTSVSYIGLTYLSVMVPSFIRCSLSCYPPVSIDDRMYLLNLNAFDFRAGNNTGGALYAMNQELGANLTPDETQYWKNWLVQHGCEEFEYNAEAFAKMVPKSQEERQRDREGQEEGEQGGGHLFNRSRFDDEHHHNISGNSNSECDHDLDLDMNFDLEQQQYGYHKRCQPGSDGNDEIGGGLVGRSAATVPSLSFTEALLDRPSSHNNTDDAANAVRNEAEQPTCAICLLAFEEPGSVAITGDANDANADGEHDQPGAVERDHGDHSNDEFSRSHHPQSATIAVENDEEGNVIPDATAAVNNTVIVRYPCTNNHYFHAHCLKSWLQVSNNRGGNQFITCPCCRQTPTHLDSSDNNNYPNATPHASLNAGIDSSNIAHSHSNNSHLGRSPSRLLNQ